MLYQRPLSASHYPPSPYYILYARTNGLASAWLPPFYKESPRSHPYSWRWACLAPRPSVGLLNSNEKELYSEINVNQGCTVYSGCIWIFSQNNHQECPLSIKISRLFSSWWVSSQFGSVRHFLRKPRHLLWLWRQTLPLVGVQNNDVLTQPRPRDSVMWYVQNIKGPLPAKINSIPASLPNMHE